MFDLTKQIGIYLLNHHVDLINDIIESGVVEKGIMNLKEIGIDFEKLTQDQQEAIIKSIAIWIVIDGSTEANVTLAAARAIIEKEHPEWGKLSNDDIKAHYFDLMNTSNTELN